MSPRHREDTISAALSHYHAADVLDKIRHWARNPFSFDAYDVYLSLRPGIRATLDASPNTMGGIFQAAQRMRIIKDSGKMAPSGKPESRGRRVVRWVGVR